MEAPLLNLGFDQGAFFIPFILYQARRYIKNTGYCPILYFYRSPRYDPASAGSLGDRIINMPFMYILECSDGTFYTGSTWNLEKRLEEHKKGQGANYTKKRLPINLVYSEKYNSIKKAFQRERQIHNWGHEKKKALINKDKSLLSEKSKKIFPE
jgi:putative endonuclease